MKNRTFVSLCSLFLVATSPVVRGAATIVIQNGDGAGVGFNDATPVAPVGGNPGTTLGQQRLNAFQEAANIWAASLNSSVTIRVSANWEALSCTATSAILGSAGTLAVFSDFAGAPVAGHWYQKPLANKLAGADLDASTADIRARFNVNLGNPGCLTGTPFYLGLDNNHGSNVDLVTVVLHELSHGLGFATFTSAASGARLVGVPSIYDKFLLDTALNQHWDQETDAQRAASAINTGKLVWDGPNVVAAVPSVLSQGAPRLQITAPAAAIASYLVGQATFGPALSNPGVLAEVMPVVDTAPNSGFCCSALSPLNAAAVAGKIALVDRGNCNFDVKVKNCQNAGAVGVIVVNNTPGSPPGAMGGSDATITIPSVLITQADGNALRARLTKRTRTHSGVFANIGIDLSLWSGANQFNEPFMYTPNPLQIGSSVSHWDTTAFPNQLMEPAINSDLTHSVLTPQDLTLKFLQDLGW